MVQWFVLDSLHADYASVIAGLQTATEAKYAGSVNQSIRDASHDANIKLVKSSIEEAERVGALAPLARSNYGAGVYKDEYPTFTEHALEAFSLLGEAPANIHYEMPSDPDGSWNWTLEKTLPDSAGDGTTYGDRIVGAPTSNGPGGSIPDPPALNGHAFFHGFFIGVWPGTIGGRSIAGFAELRLINGTSPTEKLNYRWDHWLKPGAISQGLVLQENAWIKDPGSNAYSVIEGSAAHDFTNQTRHKHYDPNFETLEFSGELPVAADVTEVQATPGTFVFDATLDGGNGGWWVHMPDGSDPTGRVVGLGDFGFRLNFRYQQLSETVKENVAFHALKGRQLNISIKPNTSDILIMRHIDFHMLNLKYTTSGSALLEPWVQGTGVDTAVTDMLIYIDQMGRGDNGNYVISQDGFAESGKFERIRILADPKARDGRENIFDVGGAVPSEANTDGHAAGFQMIDDGEIGYLKIRRCGGAIVNYFRNWGNDLMNYTNRPVRDVWVHDNDVAEHSEFYPGIGQSSSVGIAYNSDNNFVGPTSGMRCSNNRVMAYDTNPALGFVSCYRNLLPDQVLFEGNIGDLALDAAVKGGKAAVHKWLVMSGATGAEPAIGDFLEDNAAPGVKIGRIVKVDGANPTPTIHYYNAVSQTGAPQDVATGVTVNVIGGSFTGVTNGANGARTLGSNTKIAASAIRRTNLGNNGGAANALSVSSGAPRGGADPLERLTGGWYLDEQDTDYNFPAAEVGVDLTGYGPQTVPDYQANVDAGNIYGVGSVNTG